MNSNIKKIIKKFKLNEEYIYGWGKKKSGMKAIKKAKEKNKEYSILEEGFIRSIFPNSKFFYSLLTDKKSVYYNYNGSSFEEDLNKYTITNKEEEIEAIKMLEKIKKEKISKYNHWSEDRIEEEYILVVDQVENDLSLFYGKSTITTEQLIEIAKKENPNKKIKVKIHPKNKDKKFKCEIIKGNINPFNLLEKAEKVYVRTSQLGFEALLMNKKVICFGIPFYSHRGLTEDRVICEETLLKRNKKTILEIFWFAYNVYPIYINRNGERSNLKETIEEIVELKKNVVRIGEKAIVIGFSLRKYFILKKFLKNEIKTTYIPKIGFLENLAKKIYKNRKVIKWGVYKEEENQNSISVEDGFIRSKGLGCYLVKPNSLCFDDLGIYFNPQKNSRLEEILKNEINTENVSSLIEKIKKEKISKYGEVFNENITIETNKKKILIPGQVLRDASIKYGAIGEIKNNLDLVKEVRKRNPEAYLIYKEHPDVVVKKRKAENINLFKEYCDLTIQKGNIIDLIENVDEIHTLTSTTGLEGIIRDKKVVCYGFPFYAGYGLTEDIIKYKNRPQITKEKLIAGCLIEYPSYLNQGK